MDSQHVQVRHTNLGIYQGECFGLGFWHPTSNIPELGFCEFPNRQEAEKFIDFLCSNECSAPLKREDLSVEPFNKEEDDKLIGVKVNE